MLGGYYRINDNWGVGAYDRYEGQTGFLEEQRYSIYRDLTSWVASLGGSHSQQRRRERVWRAAHLHPQGAAEIQLRFELRSRRAGRRRRAASSLP